MEQRNLELELHKLQVKQNESSSEQLRNKLQVVEPALQGLLTKIYILYEAEAA